MIEMKTYAHLALGGTFDRLHAGHELFLQTALERASRQLTIGITTPALFMNKPLAQTIESFTERENNVKNFLAKINKKSIFIKTIPLDTIYGSTLTDVTIDGLAVTPETKPGGEMINRKREEAGMKPLNMIEVPLVPATDGHPISSFRIRYGDIDRQGQSYYELLVSNRIFYLPEQLRTTLREPIGDLFENPLTGSLPIVNRILANICKKSFPMIITIGDIIFQKMTEAGRQPDLAVIDFKTRREALSGTFSPILQEAGKQKYRNAAGTIECEAIKALYRSRDRFMESKTPQLVVIDGEEDLLALPAILAAPLGSFVLYGQFDRGVVAVEVTETKKNEVQKLLGRFTRRIDD